MDGLICVPLFPHCQVLRSVFTLQHWRRYLWGQSVSVMYGHTYSKSMDQPGKVANANPARGQLNRENEYFPVRVRA